MTFADLRQRCLQAHTLNPAYFGEEVEISDPEDPELLVTVRVKIEHEQVSSIPANRRTSDSGNEQRRGTFDERERIRVTVSRDANWPYAYPQRPQPAARLLRAEARDSDRRPFVFRGEVVYEGDQHAVYSFERPRRIGQGRGY